MKLLSLLFTLSIAIIIIAFAALNATSVEINYLFGVKTLPLVALLLLAFIIGILLALCIVSFKVVRLKAKNKKLEETLKEQKLKLSSG